MARRRNLAPQFFTHPDLFEAEHTSGLPVRLAFAGLWTQADRRGVFEWKPRVLKVAILPHDAVDFSATLDALERAKFIQSYTVDGERYGVIRSFPKWQTFHYLEKPSRHPGPDHANADFADVSKAGEHEANPRSLPRSLRLESESVLGSNPVPPRVNPTEIGNRKSEIGDRSAAAAAARVPAPADAHAPTHAPDEAHQLLGQLDAARDADLQAAIAEEPMTARGEQLAVREALEHTEPVREGELSHRIRLVNALNTGIDQQLGAERPQGYTAASPGAHSLARQLESANVDLTFACNALFTLAATRPLVDGKPPRTPGYFTGAVVDAWALEQQRRAGADLPSPSLLSLNRGHGSSEPSWDDLIAAAEATHGT